MSDSKIVIIDYNMGKPQHGVDAIKNGADAIAAAYIFHFSRFTPDDIKEKCHEHKILVRR